MDFTGADVIGGGLFVLAELGVGPCAVAIRRDFGGIELDDFGEIGDGLLVIAGGVCGIAGGKIIGGGQGFLLGRTGGQVCLYRDGLSGGDVYDFGMLGVTVERDVDLVLAGADAGVGIISGAESFAVDDEFRTVNICRQFDFAEP